MGARAASETLVARPILRQKPASLQDIEGRKPLLQLNIACVHDELRSFPSSMSGVIHIQPTSIQHTGESSPGSADGQHIIATKHRWSSIALKFEDVSPDAWCEFSFEIACDPEDEARTAHDFAAVGVSFLTADGSSIDFAYVPGLARAQIDPYNDYVAGPAYQGRKMDSAHPHRRYCNFLIPSPTKDLSITIRSWRNSRPFHVINPVLRQFAQAGSLDAEASALRGLPANVEHVEAQHVRRNWKTLTTEPEWFVYGLVPGCRLFMRGQLVTTGSDKAGALARIVFRDASGKELPPPYPETLMMPAIGAFIRIPSHMQARRFTLELIPPPQASVVEVGFQALSNDSRMELIVPLEVSLENRLLLESISGADLPDAKVFVERLSGQLNLLPTISSRRLRSDALDELLDREALGSLVCVQDRLRAVQRGAVPPNPPDQLRLGTFASWPLPENPSWAEDPFRSPSWRLEYQSLSWLLDLARSSAPAGFAKALELALSWSRTNPSGLPTDILSAHPMSMATRAEVLIQLLAMGVETGREVDPERLFELLGEAIRHGFALSEIISQKVFPNSIYQVHAAGSLLALAKALPRLTLAGHWTSVALAHLRAGFDELIDEDGTFNEQSLHDRLELVSLGLILSSVLEGAPEAAAFRQHIAPRLQRAGLGIIALIDPAGMLPPFGDTPHGYHYASWVRRLITQYGQDWLKKDEIRSELSYPQGSRISASPHSGVIAARFYRNSDDWSYFCATVSEQRHSLGHNDCTSFVFAGKGVRWITDTSGSSQQETGPARQYLVSSRAHNVAIPDGREPTAGAAWVLSTTTHDGASVFQIGSNVHGPDYTHRRIFVISGDLGAIAVFDRFITSDRPMTFEGYLHFDPHVMAAIAGPNLIVGFKDQKRLRVIPRSISGRLSGLDIAQGLSDHPAILQGFVSRRTGRLDPASVLRYRFAGQRNVCGGVILALDDASLKSITRIIDSPLLSEILSRSATG